MQESMIITDRDSMLENPLDLLLLRKRNFPLFARNDPDCLRFLVGDEIHTFDGVQGSDLACLFRRIKHRLRTPENHLCCVGTSATAGDSDIKLVEYAGAIFGESFAGDAVIGEDRLSAEEYLEEKVADLDAAGSFPRLPAFRDFPFDGTIVAHDF